MPEIYAIDRSILADIDILKTVPCATIRTPEEISGLMNLYYRACAGDIQLRLLADYGQYYGYNPPSTEQEINRMLTRWHNYIEEMSCIKIFGEKTEAVVAALAANGVKTLLSTDTRKCINELTISLLNENIKVINPALLRGLPEDSND